MANFTATHRQARGTPLGFHDRKGPAIPAGPFLCLAHREQISEQRNTQPATQNCEARTKTKHDKHAGGVSRWL